MLRFILPSILWTLFVIFMSLVPSSNFSLREFQFQDVDKITHFIMYSLLSLFWSVGLKRQNKNAFLRKQTFVIAIFGGFALSLILEILQEYFTISRSFEYLDLLANGVGCIFGVIIFKIMYKGVYNVE